MKITNNRTNVKNKNKNTRKERLSDRLEQTLTRQKYMGGEGKEKNGIQHK